jgi:hypothetical protein
VALDKALAEGVQNRQTIDQQATKIKEGREALIALEQQMLEAIDQLQQEVHADLLCWRASLPVIVSLYCRVSSTTQPGSGLEYSQRYCGWNTH